VGGPGHVSFADVDAHYERARAEIVHPPRDESYGRTYTARDLDGHPWFHARLGPLRGNVNCVERWQAA